MCDMYRALSAFQKSKSLLFILWMIDDDDDVCCGGSEV